jgi:hypothetical protein
MPAARRDDFDLKRDWFTADGSRSAIARCASAKRRSSACR